MKNKILVANWKMNPKTAGEAKKIFLETQKGLAKLTGLEVVVCPPVVYLPELSKSVRQKLKLGVQDVSVERVGAYTGQVSPVMVKQYKAEVAIIGHSERRACGESDELVAQKVRHALTEKMTVVVCVGELERSDEGTYYTFVRNQLERVIAILKPADLKRCSIAYEPVWAIGKQASGALDAPAVYEMVLFIRKVLTEHMGRASAGKVPILYGAAVKAENAHAFIEEGGVDGLLVGSASLDPKQFITIAKAIISK